MTHLPPPPEKMNKCHAACKYPVVCCFEAVAHKHGVGVSYGDYPAAGFRYEGQHRKLIYIPERFGPLKRCWAIAHELGHILHGHGWLFELRPYDEDEADAWAASQMVPDRDTDPGLPLWEYHGINDPSGPTKKLSREIIERSNSL